MSQDNKKYNLWSSPPRHLWETPLEGLDFTYELELNPEEEKKRLERLKQR